MKIGAGHTGPETLGQPGATAKAAAILFSATHSASLWSVEEMKLTTLAEKTESLTAYEVNEAPAADAPCRVRVPKDARLRADCDLLADGGRWLVGETRSLQYVDPALQTLVDQDSLSPEQATFTIAWATDLRGYIYTLTAEQANLKRSALLTERVNPEEEAMKEYRGALGRVILCTWVCGYFKWDTDGREGRRDLKFSEPMPFFVLPTPEYDVLHWNDDFLDPEWHLKPVFPNHPELHEYNGFSGGGTSREKKTGLPATTEEQPRYRFVDRDAIKALLPVPYLPVDLSDVDTVPERGVAEYDIMLHVDKHDYRQTITINNWEFENVTTREQEEESRQCAVAQMARNAVSFGITVDDLEDEPLLLVFQWSPPAPEGARLRAYLSRDEFSKYLDAARQGF